MEGKRVILEGKIKWEDTRNLEGVCPRSLVKDRKEQLEKEIRSLFYQLLKGGYLVNVF